MSPPGGGRTDADPSAQAPVALYVHVPFCVSICPYCDFVVVAGSSARGARSSVAPYVRAVLAEISLRARIATARFGEPGSATRPLLGSVYLGGGTPTLLPAEDVGLILAAIESGFGIAADGEITIEANPGPDEHGDLEALRAVGVTRLSIGAQRLDSPSLRLLGRRHDPTDVADVVGAARRAGIPSVGLDLLYDLPDEELDAWVETLESAIALSPDHLSLYALTLDDPDAEGITGPLDDHLPTRAGARRWRTAARAGQDEDRAAAMYHHASARLEEIGFDGYEISNWARPGHASRHNLAYWERRPYEAVGPGSHAFDGVTRRWDAAPLAPWMAALVPGDGSSPTLPPGGEVNLTAAEAAAEGIILGLRTSRGIEEAAGREEPLASSLNWGLEHELIERTPDERIVLTTRGRLLSNELFARLV